MHLSVFLLFTFSLLLSSKANGGGKEAAQKLQALGIGAIIDCSTRVGKEERIAMNMAVDDYRNYTNRRLDLYIEDLGKDPTQMAYIGMDLIKQKKVGAILGVRKMEEATLMADFGAKAGVPILSFADPLPLNSKRWPSLIQAAQSQYHQMEAVADMLRTRQFRKVNIIYEDSTFTIIHHLLEILRDAEIYTEHLLALQPSASSSWISKNLVNVAKDQCRVFIVHTSLPLATDLFIAAKQIRLMEEDSVWITTNSITDLLHSFDLPAIALMEGVMGIKTYFPQTGVSYNHFKSRFRRRFLLAYPKEARSEPGIFALQAYDDALWAVALAIGGRTNQSSTVPSMDQLATGAQLHQETLFHKITHNSFEGLTGEFRLKENRLSSSQIFQIVNVIQNNYKELGYWSKGRGFSEHLNEGARYNRSMKVLGELVLPGGLSAKVPRGWALPTSGRPLKIAVPGMETVKQYVDISRDDITGKLVLGGFSGEVFNAVLDKMPYQFPYEFIIFNDTYDNMIKEISYQTFDAAVGDTTILAHRYKYAEFSQPWMDSGIQMVVLKKRTNRAWLFLKPFSIGLWVSTASITIYNGFVIWLMERKHYQEYNGSALNRAGALTWLAFATLFSREGERLHSNLTRMTMLIWLFVSVIIIQSYTATLTSMLTIPWLDKSDITLEFLKKTDAKVGCDGVSFVYNYLQEVLGLHEENIKKYNSSTEYPQALEKGEIKAAFMEVPYIKIFMAINCKRFTVVGQVYRVGGFRFAFRKGSPMLPDISRAILDITESGKMLELENAIIDSNKCQDSDDDQGKLSVTSFWGLFLISGITSTVALVIYLLRAFKSTVSEHSQHDPDADERFMFASEMGEHNSSQHDPDADERFMFALEIGEHNSRNRLGSSYKGLRLESLAIGLLRGWQLCRSATLLGR